jgi:hypothetical protein
MNQNEQVIWEGSPAIESRRKLGCLGKILIFILIAAGLGTIMLHGLGVVFLFLAAAYYVYIKTRSDPSSSINYTLTNQRAIVLDISHKKNPIISKECDLKNVVPISQNKTNVSHTRVVSTNSNQQRSDIKVIGDVSFLEGTYLRVVFRSVVDPEGIVKTVEEIKKSMFIS